MPIRVNVAATLKELKKEGHKIYIITARAYADRKNFFGWLMRACLKHWLKRNEVPYDGLYFVNMENSPEEKANLIKKLNIDYFIEDTPENIEKMKEYCKVICIKADYNRDLTGVTYANDFYDIYAIINHQPVIEQLHGNPSMQRQYYESLPYDEGALHQYKRNTQLAIKTLGTLLKCFIKLEIVGQENIPKEGGVVFACNHRRSMDIPIMYLALRDNYARFLIKMEYELSKFRFLQKPLGTIYVNRESKYSSRTARTSMIEALLHGTNVLIFPEGVWNTSENQLVQYLFPGTAEMAIRTGADIVPIAIEEFGKEYRINIGQNISTCKWSLEQKQELTNYLRDAMATLKWEIYETRPVAKRATISANAGEDYRQNFINQAKGVFTWQDFVNTSYRPRDITTPADAFAYLDKLIPRHQNAFLFRKGARSGR